jgi:hypothetical protein
MYIFLKSKSLAAAGILFMASSAIPTPVYAVEEAGSYADFAALEAQGICPDLIARASPGAQAIQSWGQEELDRLYACLHAGPIPNGFMEGTVILANGGNFEMFQKFILGKLGLPIDAAKTKQFAEAIWKGKIFKPESKTLLNQIGPEAIPILKSKWPDMVIPGNKRFPAKVFCGMSILDGRRESIVIDYFNTEQLTPDYVESVDWIAGKKGLKVRDEARMVRPGFYLGRAYMDRVFVLNFTLTASSSAGPSAPKDTCWGGEQRSQ